GRCTTAVVVRKVRAVGAIRLGSSPLVIPQDAPANSVCARSKCPRSVAGCVIIKLLRRRSKQSVSSIRCYCALIERLRRLGGRAVIEMRRKQLSFGDGLIAEEVSDLREDWMKHADEVLADEEVVTIVYEALAKRHPKSRCRGRRGTPADAVLRLLILKHVRNWSYEVLEREVRATADGIALVCSHVEVCEYGEADNPLAWEVVYLGTPLYEELFRIT